jgi:glycosyltransferase involved in cell wall biosynthesis
MQPLPQSNWQAPAMPLGRPLRVAFVQHEFPALSQTFVQNEIDLLQRQGVQISVFYVRDATVKGPSGPDWDVVRFTSQEHLVHLLTSRRIDLVHTHFAVPHPRDRIIPVCERLQIPFTIKPHAFDIFRRDIDPRHNIRDIGQHPLCRAIYCEGEFHRRFLSERGVPVEKLAVVRNIFDLEEFWEPGVRVAPTLTRIVAISRFVEKKGYHFLIEAFRRLKNENLRLDLYGYGEERERLENLAAGDSRIGIHEGPRTAADNVVLLRQADLVALPCVVDKWGDTDGLPTVLMEAMAAGVPVLSTAVASTPDLVLADTTGWMVEMASVDALVDGLSAAIQSSQAERLRLVNNARNHLRAEFASDLNIQRLLYSWQAIFNHA